LPYNPLLDLVTGLLLILVPLFILVGFGIGIFVSHTRRMGEKPRGGSPEDWTKWVAATLAEAQFWAGELERNPPPQAAGKSALESLIDCLERTHRNLTGGEPGRKLEHEIARSLEILHQHQDKLLREMRGLSEENSESLNILLREAEKIQALLQRDPLAVEWSERVGVDRFGYG